MRALLAIAIVGCAGHAPADHPPAAPDRFRELLVQRDACHAPPAATVSRAAALADAAIVERVIRRGDARFDEPGDWDAAFADLRRAITALPEPIATTELRRAVVHALATSHDAALAVWSIGPEGRELTPATAHHDAYTAELAVSRAGIVTRAADPELVGGALDCADPLRPAPDGKLAIVLATTPPPPLHCRVADREVGLPLHRLRATPDPERATFERTGAFLRLRDLDPANQEALDVFVEAAAIVAAAPVAVLDVRGIRGGREATVIEFFAALLGRALRPPTTDVLTSEVTLQGQINAVTCTLARSDVDREARLGLEVRRRDLSQAIDDAALKAPTRTHVQPRAAPPPTGHAVYQGTLVVVVDAACSGTCELIVALARQLPHAVVVGENTAGARAGELLPYRLPNSGLWLDVPASSILPADAPAEPDVGYLPDLWLDTDKLDLRPVASCVLDATCR